MKLAKKYFIPVVAVLAVAAVVLILLMTRDGIFSGSGDQSVERPFQVFRMDLSDKITEIGEVKPIRVFSLRFPVDEKVVKIYVSEDEIVKKGDPLLCIDDTQVLSRKNSLESQILKTEYELAASETVNKKMKLELEENILNARNNVFLNERKKEVAREMFEKDLISRDKLDFIENQALAARNALEMLLEEEKKVEKESLRVKAVEKTLESLKYQLKQLEEILNDCCLEAPADGKVIWMSQVKEGEIAVRGEPAVRVANLQEIEITTQLFESDVWRIERGAEIFVRSGEERIPAELKRISSVAEKSQSGTRFPCYLRAENIGERFRVGSNVEVLFLVDKRPNVLVVPLKYLIQKEGGSFVLKKEEKRVRETPVETGFDDTRYVEIIDGLKEGDTIIYPYERF
ncbi:MAG: HlyD family efflux transporter periplasmic adaptor subunit [Candidatus Aminicenantes bacterium]|nr:HlyD family efflux transporter periplasmic adaptor subunit [Candidatus Aminicenantes bacterium]